MTQQRDPEIIQREIEHTRAQLAQTLDELALRASPKRVVEQGKEQLLNTPKGRAVVGGAAGLSVALIAVKVVGKVRNRRRSRFR